MWKESDEAKKVHDQIAKFHDEKRNEESQADKSPDSGLSYAAPLWQQYVVVQRRAFSNYNRDVTCAFLCYIEMRCRFLTDPEVASQMLAPRLA